MVGNSCADIQQSLLFLSHLLHRESDVGGNRQSSTGYLRLPLVVLRSRFLELDRFSKKGHSSGGERFQTRAKVLLRWIIFGQTPQMLKSLADVENCSLKLAQKVGISCK